MTTLLARRSPWRGWLAAALLTAGGSATAATFVVNDRFDAGTGGCTVTECTLREAIVAANATTAADTINFSFRVLEGKEILIQPTTALPTITQPLTINGYSVANASVNTDPVASNAVLRIRVDGVNAGASAGGLSVCANNVVIKGLSITSFSQQGVKFGSDAAGSLCAAPVTGGSVAGNFIGLAVNGTTAAGNASSGVLAFGAQVTVGSAAVADRNVIGSNASGAITLVNATSSSSSVLGNLIGTDKSGALDRGNAGAGVDVAISAAAVTVGSAVAPNRIAYNGRGVSVTNTTGNRLFANHYGPNDGLGIDLFAVGGGSGVSANDNADADSGGNGQQNYLDAGFTADRTPTGINIQGTLRRSPSGTQTFTIAAYATSACDASGHGEGETFLGTATEVTINATAAVNVDIPLATQPPPGSFITTTVTAPDGSTSELSSCAPLDPPPLVVTSTADTDGTTCGATCTLRQAINVANLTTEPDVIQFAINPGVTVGELLIQPATVLPTITQPLLIDGYSQSGTAANTDPQLSNAQLRVRVDGTNVVTASAAGLAICAPNSTIRGLSITGFSAVGYRAIRAGKNGTGGACTLAPTGSVVAGNFIGLACDGTTAASNRSVDITDESVTVGGTAIADRNVIAASLNNGIDVLAGNGAQTGASILNNLIGTDKGGTLDRGNNGPGVFIRAGAGQVTIGSVAAPNLIRFNVLSGIATQSDATIANNAWGANRIFGNDTIGIDLALDDVTLNDLGADDADTGPNGLQNFPVLSLAERSAVGIRIRGTLDVKAGTSNVPYAFSVYANAACDASGHGEGERLLGAATVNLTQTSGESFSFELSTDDPLEAGVQITAIATGPEGSSEFSACLAATDAPLGIGVNSINDPGTGTCDVAECTLREAITLANTQAGADLIRFEIPGDGPHEIDPASLLPFITEALTIDGYTQPGAAENAAAPQAGSDAVLKIVLDGQNVRANLLRTCTTGAVEIRGLALGRASNAAIATQSNDNASCSAVGSLILKGNYIGLRPEGTAFVNGSGVLVSNTVATVGGSAPADRNLISSSITIGVRIAGAASNGSTVQNNLIGAGESTATDRGNLGAGIEINGASDLTIGGEGTLANVIAFNARGVLMLGAGTGNRVYANEYVANDTLGIDLSLGAAFDGVTANDINDVDPGPNGLQNFPQLSDGSATANSITINGTLDVPAGIAAPLPYTLAFYESAACDASDNGEGEIYLGSRSVDLASAAENFSVTLALPPSATPSVITATATDPAGSTSEFSNCLAGPQPEEIFANGFED